MVRNPVIHSTKLFSDGSLVDISGGLPVTEWTQSIVDGDENNVTVQENVGPVKPGFSVAISHDETAPVDPEHHRTQRSPVIANLSFPRSYRLGFKRRTLPDLLEVNPLTLCV